jgi:hypothetical protein
MKSMMMMNDFSDFFMDDPWEQIPKPSYPNGRRLYLNDARFWVSRDNEGYILFFIQDSTDEVLNLLENLSFIELSEEKYSKGELRLICTLRSHDVSLKEKFSIVAKDIAFHCSQFSGTKVFNEAQQRLKGWANFLKPTRGGLSTSEFVGFFGELYLLTEILLDAIGAEGSIKAWVGPDGKKQDFTIETYAIEVKTSLSGDQQTIRISSLDQLDKVTQSLFLVRIVASPSVRSLEFSLKNMYEKCLRAIGADVILQAMFLQKVSGLYGKASESQLNDTFEIVNHSIYLVDQEFPKLTRADVDLAIRDVHYDISLSAIAKFEISGDLKEILKNGTVG